MRRAAAVVILLCVVSGGTGRADERPGEKLPFAHIDQRLNEQVPLNLWFYDEAGQAVQLNQYFHDKPVILVLGYYRCPMLCNQVLNGISQTAMSRSFGLRIGEDFQIVNVSFDAHEHPDLARAKKANYVSEVQCGAQPNPAAGWHFLTGVQSSIDTLTEAVGFYYEYNPANEQFGHGSAIMVLTPSGKISRYFFGIAYDPKSLRLALVEASANKIGTPVDHILLLCYHFDPHTGKYSLAVLALVRLGGIVTVVCLGTFIVMNLRRGRRRTLKPGSTNRG